METLPELKLKVCRTQSALPLKLMKITKIILAIEESYVYLK